MPFLGKQPPSGFSSFTKQDLTADGSTTGFTLNKNVASANDVEVFVGNVRQEPTDAYTVSGNTLTMTAAPSSGTNFYVLFKEATQSTTVPSAGTTVPGNFGMSGNLDVDGTATIDGNVTTTGDITASNSSGHRSLTVKGNQLSNYQGGSILLANEAMGTNYGGTYLYHHKAGGGATSTNAAFNISQRTATGSYVSNIWNVDYDNTVSTFYLPNGALSGAAVMQLESNGAVTKPKQPTFRVYNGGSQTLGTDASPIVIDFDDEGFDVGGGYNPSTNRYTAPTSGYYYMNAAVMFESNFTNYTYIWMSFRINGTVHTAGEDMMPRPSGGQFSTLSKNEIIYLSSGDYVEVLVAQSQGTGATIRTGFRRFQGYLLG